MVKNLLLALVFCVLVLGGRSSAAWPSSRQGQEPPIAAISLFGQPLMPPAMAEEQRKKLQADFDEAHERYLADPEDAKAIVWLGRRHGYLWQYTQAIGVFTRGIELHPDDARMYRHRGHRYISTRKFEKAIADFEKAAELIEGTEDEVEPDGQPNAAGIPTSTLHTNIYYHLGLAYYLTGDFERALAAYEKCLAAAKNNDMRVATLDWMWMTLRRLDRPDQAARVIAEVTPELKVLENHAYHRRLLMYQGKLRPEDLLQANDDLQADNDSDKALNLATYGYGVGNWYFVNGDTDKASEIFKRVTDGEHWSAFGFIAAEADLKRMADGGEAKEASKDGQ